MTIKAYSNLPLKWTKKLPTKSGWYWVWWYKIHITPFMMQAHKTDIGVTMDGYPIKEYTEVLFAGPIPLPKKKYGAK